MKKNRARTEQHQDPSIERKRPRSLKALEQDDLANVSGGGRMSSVGSSTPW